MLKLHTFRPYHGALSASPFTCKADALLTMAGLPFERVFADVRKSPTGKLPVLVDGETVVADSDNIRAHLERVHGADFDGHITNDQRAMGRAIQRVVEHHAYFINAHFRWTQQGDAVRDAYFLEAPAFLRGVIFRVVARSVGRTMHMQGLGRHDDATLERFLREDYEAISQLLGKAAFIGGAEPCSFDAALWAALHSTLNCDLPSPGRTAIRAHDNLVAYEARFRERVYGADYPDLDQLT